jgi:hypothetical protein
MNQTFDYRALFENEDCRMTFYEAQKTAEEMSKSSTLGSCLSLLKQHKQFLAINQRESQTFGGVDRQVFTGFSQICHFFKRLNDGPRELVTDDALPWSFQIEDSAAKFLKKLGCSISIP